MKDVLMLGLMFVGVGLLGWLISVGVVAFLQWLINVGFGTQFSINIWIGGLVFYIVWLMFKK